MKFNLHLIILIASLSLFACASVKPKEEINAKKNITVIKKNNELCSSSDARSSAFRKLWRIYGKEDIRMPYEVKSKGDMWDVYGYRNKEHLKTVHVIIPKADKNCAVKEIKHERLKYCTLIGCDNSITVSLTSPLKPGKYSVYTKFDNEKKTNKIIILVSKNAPSNCKRHKNIAPNYSLLLDFSHCNGSKEIIKIGWLTHFTIRNDPRPIDQTLEPVKMSITIKNFEGISILKKEQIIRYNKQYSSQPNGKDCEPICYKSKIKL